MGNWGTDQAEEFVAAPDTAANHDASGGADSLTGSTLNDTLAGGAGNDVFVATQDATEVIQISDFNLDEDAIAIETKFPEEASITEQLLEEGGLRIELSTGLSSRLERVSAPVPASSVQVAPVSPLEPA